MILVEVYVISMNEYVDILLDEELPVGQAMEEICQLLGQKLNTSIGEVSVNGRGSHRSFEQDGDTNRKLVIDNSTGDIELTYR